MYMNIEYIYFDQSTMLHGVFQYNDWIVQYHLMLIYVQLIYNSEVLYLMDIVVVHAMK